MNIGFDAKRAFLNHTGLGNYGRTVISSLVLYFPENDYKLYTTARRGHDFDDFVQQNKLKIKLPQTILPGALWRSYGIVNELKKDKIQIYHGLSNEIPLGIHKSGCASVVTIHDLIFLRFPELYPFIDRNIYRLKTLYACRNADRIIAVSQQTKKDIVCFWGVNEEKIEVIHQSVDKQFLRRTSETERQEIRRLYQLPEKYILSIGTIERRKNLLLAVQALLKTDDAVSLVIVGKATRYWDEVLAFIEKYQLQSRIFYLPQIPFSHFPALYQNAQIFVYPSLFEGFGIPVLEAVSSGIPVIAARGSCLEEAGGTGSVYINPQDADELAAAINNVLYNDDLRKQMISEGLSYSKQFSDRIIAENVMNVYKKIV